MVATRKAIDNKKNIIDLYDKYIILCKNNEFLDATSQHTTNINNIMKRIDLAYQILYEG